MGYLELDYSAGVLPVTHVDRHHDAQPNGFNALNSIERSVYRMYNAEIMHGLPIGVQVVGKRLEEEKVLAGMKLIEGLLKANGQEYQLLET